MCLDAAPIDRIHSVQDEKTRLRYIISRVRENFPGVPIVLVPENMPGMVGSYLHEHVRDMQPLITMQECKNARSPNMMYGVFRDARVELRQREEAILMMSRGAVRVSHRAFAVPHAGKSGAIEPELEKLGNQACQYEGMKKVVKGERSNQDLLVAFIMGFYWRLQFLFSGNPAYTEFISRAVTGALVRMSPHNS